MPDTSDYHRPDNLADALAVLAQGGVTIAAGCTDLFPATERKRLPGAVLDVTGIANLRPISKVDGGLRIGATATWSDVLEADLPPALNGLKLAAREVGATQIQNQATVAGNLCNASPAADGVPPLLTLDARVELQSATQTRALPIREFLVGPRQTARAPGELVTGLFIPDEALTGRAQFMKLGARKYLVISIVMTAARVVIEGGLVTSARLAVGACGPVATRVGAAERALIGAPLTPEAVTDEMIASALSPIDDVRADASYRAQAAGELMRRTLKACQAEGTA